MAARRDGEASGSGERDGYLRCLCERPAPFVLAVGQRLGAEARLWLKAEVSGRSAQGQLRELARARR
eukprot:3253478-Pyramimonas_sp.AAC.1